MRKMGLPIEYEGKIYCSINEFAKEFGLPNGWVNYRLEKGMTVEEMMKDTVTKIHYNGKEYTALTQIAEEYGVSYYALYAGLRKGKTLDAAMETTLAGKKRRELKRIDVIHNGVQYDSLTSLSKAVQVSENRLRRGFDLGLSIDEIIESKKSCVRKVLEFNDKKYINIRQIIQEEGVTQTAVYERLAKGFSLEESISIAKQKLRTVEYKGKKYGNLRKLAEEIGIPYVSLIKRRRLYRTLEEAIDGYSLPKKRKNIPVTYKDKNYTSIKKLSEDTGVSYQTLKIRILSGMNVDDAVKKPLGIQGRKKKQ